MLRFLWLIPLLPFAGALVNGLFGRRLPVRAIHTVACGAVLLAFLLSLGSILDLAGGLEEYRELASAQPERYELSGPGEPARFEVTPAEWIPFGALQEQGATAVPGLERDRVLRVGWTFQIDALTAVMLLVVTGIGFLIHVYSMGYMAGDPGYARFFAYMNLFTGAMLTLVLGGNFLVMFVGWEGVGLCSYLLIGYYYDQVFDRESGLTCSDAGRKAFIVNRIGDFAFLIGVLLIVVLFGTLDFSEVAARINGHSAAWFGSGVLTLIGILFFVGATGKSAQIPLYVWLPDAMAGPTPVSALIHAATMVTAGVYMLARTSALYWHAPDAMVVVAVVGCLTAVFAATMGLVQNDIKKVLAYSTVSQLGYMFLGAGVGAFVAAIFHLVTHAFFKACLFLGAGSVIHGNHHNNDMRLYGGLRKWMPWTFRTYLVATLAIAGFPLLSGFFSKDEILVSSLTSNRGNVVLWVVGSVAAILTSFYMFRTVWLTFLGENRAPEKVREHLKESPRSMTGVLVALAIGAILVGFLGVPAGMTSLVGLGDLNWFEHRVHPVVAAQGVVAKADHGSHGEVARAAASAGHGDDEILHGATAPWAGLEEGGTHPSTGQEWGLVLLAIGLFLTGWLVAKVMYGRGGDLPARVARAAGPLYRLVYRKYWVDELYDRLLIRPYYGLCRFFSGMDRWVVDGAVNGTAASTRGVSRISNGFDQWVVDLLVNFVAYFVRFGGWVMRRAQTGFVQSYAGVMILGAFALLAIYLLYLTS